MLEKLLENRINRLLALCMVFGLLFLCKNGRAQSAVYSQFTIEEGLLSDETYATFQDSKGYIWIATDRGVCKYDGNKIKTYTSKDGLPDNTIFNFYEDEQNRIWFNSFNGRLAYFKNEIFYPLKVEQKLGLICSIVVQRDTLMVLHSGNKSIINETFLIEDSSLVLISRKSVEEILTVSSSQIDSVNTKSWKGFIRPRRAGMKAKIVPHNGFVLSNKFNKWYGEDTLCIGYLGWLGFYNHGSKVTMYEHVFDNYIRRVKKIGDLYYILISKDGLYELKSDLAGLRKVLDIPFDASNFMFDNTNTLWVSTLTSGVLRYNSISIKNHNKLENKYVAGIFNTKYLWVAADTSIYLQTNEGLKPKGKLIGSVLGGLDYKVDSNFTVFSNTNFVLLKDSTITSINSTLYTPDAVAPLGEDSLLLSWWKGYTIVKNSKFQGQLSQDHWGTYPDFVGRGGSVLAIDGQRFYFGTNLGLFLYNHREKKFTSLQLMSPALSERIVQMEHWDEDYDVIATRGMGLVLGNLKDGFGSISEKDGLVSDLINKIYVSGVDSVILVATNKGLSRIFVKSIYPLSYTIENLTKEDGLSSRQINDAHIFNDTIYIATNKGMNYVPKSWRKSRFEPEISITEVKVKGEKWKLDSSYTFLYNQNMIDVRFFSPVFRGPGGMSYKFRLLKDGNISEWTTTDIPSVQFASLSPGNYKFEVIAVLHDGQSTPKPAVMYIQICPPPWLSWWAFLTYGLIIGLVFYIVFKIRLNRNREKEVIRRKMVEMELKALRSQMNPHFTFNTMNSIQHFINSNEPEEANIYISKFSRLMRLILDNSREEFITIEQELDALRLYLEIEKLRFFGKFDFQIQIDKNIDEAFERIPPLVIQPFAENAIWHGLMTKEGARNLTIKLKMQDKDGIICVVEDNGIGRKEAGKNKSQFRTRHKSHGMNITQTRLELLNSMSKNKLISKIIDLVDEKGTAMGTRVEIYIPIN